MSGLLICAWIWCVWPFLTSTTRLDDKKRDISKADSTLAMLEDAVDDRAFGQLVVFHSIRPYHLG